MDGGAGMALRNGAGLLLVRARRLHTLAGDPAEAMVVFAGRVVATGDARILAEQFPVGRTVELDGVVLPGFNDAHSHPTMTAENLLHVDCSPDLAPDEETLVRLLRDEAAHTERGGWVIGSSYDHSKTTSGRVVDRAFLDWVVPDRPVLLVHVAAHWGVLNSAGLTVARLDEETAGPPGGLLGRDGTGRLNDVVYEQALFDIAYPSLAREATIVPPSTMTQRLRGLGRTLRMFHAAGLTSTCDALCGPHDVRLLMEARAQGQLTLRTGMLVAHPHYDHLSTLGLRGGFGDDKLRLVGVKAFVDGACAGGNCLVDEPFEGTDDHGMQIMETEHIETLVRRATQDELGPHRRCVRPPLSGPGAVLQVGRRWIGTTRPTGPPGPVPSRKDPHGTHRTSAPRRRRFRPAAVRRPTRAARRAQSLGRPGRRHGDEPVRQPGRDRGRRDPAGHRLRRPVGVTACVRTS